MVIQPLIFRLLDILTLNEHQIVASYDLETLDSAQLPPGSTSKKQNIQIGPFWYWQDIHLAKQGSVSDFGCTIRR